MRRALELLLILALNPVVAAQEHGWYDVSAADKSLAEQIAAISVTGVPVTLVFLEREGGFDWSFPAIRDVHGWFTPQEALCLALAGTSQVPVPTAAPKDFVVRNQLADEPQHCEYAIPDWGPPWIHPPQADWL